MEELFGFGFALLVEGSVSPGGCEGMMCFPRVFSQPPEQGIGSWCGFQPEDNMSSIPFAGTREAGCGKLGWEAPCSV